jgi:hypothetical protein
VLYIVITKREAKYSKVNFLFKHLYSYLSIYSCMLDFSLSIDTLAMRILLVRKLHLKLKDVKFFFAFKIEFEY